MRVKPSTSIALLFMLLLVGQAMTSHLNQIPGESEETTLEPTALIMASNNTTDTDGDGVYDVNDDCANGATNWTSSSSTDYDSDGCRDSTEDSDDDNDGYSDVSELNCDSNPLDASSTPTNDLDGDGICDAQDDDVDGDGLSNVEEYQVAYTWGASQFTDPTDPDSDDDFMPDGWEANNGLNPRNGSNGIDDPDHDGFDQNGNGDVRLSEFDGFARVHSIMVDLYQEVTANQTVAWAKVTLSGASSGGSQYELIPLLAPCDGFVYSISALVNEEITERSFVWMNIVEHNERFTNLDEYEARDRDGDGVIDGRSSDPLNPDTDGDGLLDGIEVMGWTIRVVNRGVNVVHVTSDPGVFDTDGDGLDDGVELAMSTDLTSSDSDGDGIPDELDVTEADNELSVDAASKQDTISAEAGVKLKVGGAALAEGVAGARVDESTIAESGEDGGDAPVNGNDESVAYPGGLFDFEIHDLPEPGQSVRLVLPLETGIPPGGTYRKYTEVNGWADFVVDDKNSIASTLAAGGTCPEPGSTAYVSGLTEGDDCIRLEIEDGGPNDADSSVNGIIDDPGGVAELDTDNDGVGNSADTDDDGDGVDDSSDAFPLDASETLDTDSDGTGNNADTDDDGDGVSDSSDAFPVDSSESVDTDGDGIGNNADTDDDGDGVADTEDVFPLDETKSSNSSGGGCAAGTDGNDPTLGILVILALCWLARRRWVADR